MALLAIDLASNKSGWALFEAGRCIDWGIIRPRGKSGRWVIVDRLGSFVCVGSKADVWHQLLDIADHVVVERSYVGTRASAVIALSRIRGYVDAQAEACRVPVTDMTPGEWRRIAREIGLCEAWPAGRGSKKLLGIAIAHGIVDPLNQCPIGEDEADAICLGRAYLATVVEVAA